jgi:hypothetical protein
MSQRAIVWKAISDFKHPVMTGRDQDLAGTLSEPVEIRRSRGDQDVYFSTGWSSQAGGCAWSRST